MSPQQLQDAMANYQKTGSLLLLPQLPTPASGGHWSGMSSNVPWVSQDEMAMLPLDAFDSLTNAWNDPPPMDLKHMGIDFGQGQSESKATYVKPDVEAFQEFQQEYQGEFAPKEKSVSTEANGPQKAESCQLSLEDSKQIYGKGIAKKAAPQGLSVGQAMAVAAQKQQDLLAAKHAHAGAITSLEELKQAFGDPQAVAAAQQQTEKAKTLQDYLQQKQTAPAIKFQGDEYNKVLTEVAHDPAVHASLVEQIKKDVMQLLQQELLRPQTQQFLKERIQNVLAEFIGQSLTGEVLSELRASIMEALCPGLHLPAVKAEKLPPVQQFQSGATCHGCGQPLLAENAWMEDGCPCNSPAGVNAELLLLPPAPGCEPISPTAILGVVSLPLPLTPLAGSVYPANAEPTMDPKPITMPPKPGNPNVKPAWLKPKVLPQTQTWQTPPTVAQQSMYDPALGQPFK